MARSTANSPRLPLSVEKCFFIHSRLYGDPEISNRTGGGKTPYQTLITMVKNENGDRQIGLADVKYLLKN